MNLRGEPYTIIGIMPKEFRGAGPIDLWTPLRPTRTGEGSGSNYGVVARLKPGVSWAAANSQLQSLSKGLVETPGFPREYKDFEERIVPLQSGVTQDSRTQLWLTWGAVLRVLVIGCVNIAGLMLARAVGRHREIATRLALGGGRARIVRQLLTESVLLALGGCAIGVALGLKAIPWLKELGAESLEMWNPIQLNVRVLLAMLGVAIATSVAFGLAPALQTSRLDIRSVLVEGGRGVAGTRRGWTRNVLVAFEVALSLVLLVSAGLMIRTLGYLNGLNPGFDTRNVITAQASLQDARYKTSVAVNRLYRESLDRIRKIPGVQSAAVALTLPYERPLNEGFRTVDGDNNSRGFGIEVVYVTPGYFDTLRIPVRRGRVPADSDTPQSGPVAVVSESFARKYYSSHEVLGGHFKMEGAVREIVGVVGDVQQHSGLGNFGPVSIEPTIYIPAAQTSDGFLQVIHTWFPPKWVIRTTGPTGSLEGEGAGGGGKRGSAAAGGPFQDDRRTARPDHARPAVPRLAVLGDCGAGARARGNRTVRSDFAIDHAADARTGHSDGAGRHRRTGDRQCDEAGNRAGGGGSGGGIRALADSGALPGAPAVGRAAEGSIHVRDDGRGPAGGRGGGQPGAGAADSADGSREDAAERINGAQSRVPAP